MDFSAQFQNFQSFLKLFFGFSHKIIYLKTFNMQFPHINCYVFIFLLGIYVALYLIELVAFTKEIYLHEIGILSETKSFVTIYKVILFIRTIKMQNLLYYYFI